MQEYILPGSVFAAITAITVTDVGEGGGGMYEGHI